MLAGISIWMLAAVIAVLIIVGLAIYAGYLFNQVGKQRKRQDELETAAADTIRQLGEDVLDSQVRSLKIFTRLMLQDEMNLTEGAIRIKVVLDHMLTVCQRGPYQAIYTLYDKTEHLARSEIRAKLPKRERMQQDMQRMALEAEYHDSVMLAVQQLHDEMDSEYPNIKVIASA